MAKDESESGFSNVARVADPHDGIAWADEKSTSEAV